MEPGKGSNMTAGQLLRKAREARNVSLRQLALAINVSPGHVSLVETGRCRISSL
jgi:transcriptional regulator with XRE-family HTH domain